MGELKRSEFGNTASEQGAYVNGADFSTLGVGALPEGRPEAMEVDAEYVVGDGITLTPKGEQNGFHKALGDLREGPLDQLMAQLCEEPDDAGLAVRVINGLEVSGDSDRLAQVSGRSPRELLVWYGMHPEYYGAVAGDRIMLRRDVLESQYSCKQCKGQGFDEETSTPCETCDGRRTETVQTQSGWTNIGCRGCRVMGYGREGWISRGIKRCAKCNGSGWKNGLVIQEDAQKEAITGVVVSVGPYCQTWKIGDRLMFSRFAGHTLEVSKTESFIMMRESEALGMLRQRNEKP